jgi:hypothetical protein
VLRRLSVFQGGFTLDAAESVGADDNGDGNGDPQVIEANTVLDLLSQLVDKSLVAFDDGGAVGRYRLLETIRQFAAERLADAGEAPTVRRRHSNHFLLLAEKAEVGHRGHEMLRWLEVIDLEQDNIRGAMDWSRTKDDADGGLRLATAMWLYWIARGHLSEATARLDDVLAQGGGQPRLRARALIAKAEIAAMGTDIAASREIATEAVALVEPLGDVHTIAWARCIASWGYIFAEPEIADARCAEAVALARRVDDHWILANALMAYGFFRATGQEPASAIPLLEEGLSLAREHGDQLNTFESLTWLGLARFILGEFDAAETLAQEAVTNARVIGVPLYLGFAKTVLGASLTMRGAYAEAEAILDEAVALG